MSMEHAPISENINTPAKKYTKEELDSVDPKTGKTLREHLFGIEKEELKEESKGKEGKKGKKQNIYQMLFPEKKEKKSVSHEETLDTINYYLDMTSKVRAFLSNDAARIFPNLDEHEAQTQLALVAIQTLMRSQDKASLDAVKEALKNEERYIDIEGEKQNVYHLLFPEKKENTEEQRMESLKNIRHYFDMSAKIYGLLGAEVKRYFPKIGERVAQNQLALVAIDTLMQTRDKASLKAMERILKDEEKYTEEHPGSPLAELFLKMKPEIDLLIKDSH